MPTSAELRSVCPVNTRMGFVAVGGNGELTHMYDKWRAPADLRVVAWDGEANAGTLSCMSDCALTGRLGMGDAMAVFGHSVPDEAMELVRDLPCGRDMASMPVVYEEASRQYGTRMLTAIAAASVTELAVSLTILGMEGGTPFAGLFDADERELLFERSDSGEPFDPASDVMGRERTLALLSDLTDGIIGDYEMGLACSYPKHLPIRCRGYACSARQMGNYMRRHADDGDHSPLYLVTRWIYDARKAESVIGATSIMYGMRSAEHAVDMVMSSRTACRKLAEGVPYDDVYAILL